MAGANERFRGVLPLQTAKEHKDNPMVGVVRFALGCYCFFWTLRYWYWWRTANLPTKQGGHHGNPFNDPANFCCVYGAPPCPVGVTCVVEGDQLGGSQALVLYVALRPVIPWLVTVTCLGLLFMDDSGATSLGALIVVVMLSRGWF